MGLNGLLRDVVLVIVFLSVGIRLFVIDRMFLMWFLVVIVIVFIVIVFLVFILEILVFIVLNVVCFLVFFFCFLLSVFFVFEFRIVSGLNGLEGVLCRLRVLIGFLIGLFLLLIVLWLFFFVEVRVLVLIVGF